MLQAPVYLDRSTKRLLIRLPPKSIAIVAHEDLDAVAAENLINRQVLAVINTRCSLTGRYPNYGPKLLIEKGVRILDQVPDEIFDQLRDGEYVRIVGSEIRQGSKMLAHGTCLTSAMINERLALAQRQLGQQLEYFIKNTLEHALKEKELLLRIPKIPPIVTPLKGRHTVVVVRGPSFEADLKTILPYIREVRPALIAVDGGADALLQFGLKPDLIIGDMDSVSDRALCSGAELVVHAYPNGEAPGLKRVGTGKAVSFPVVGTSEDAALLLAYHEGAKLIVLVGSHSSMLEFLDKGRPGMGSTFLVRLLVGSILVDAKGVSQLYRLYVRPFQLIGFLVAGLLPAIAVFFSSFRLQQLVWLLQLKLRLVLGR